MDTATGKTSLAAALAVIDEAGLERDSRLAAAALPWLLDRLGPEYASTPAQNQDGQGIPPSGGIEKLARWSGIDIELLEENIEARDDAVVLHVNTSRLPNSTAGRQRYLTYAYLAVQRQGFDHADVDAGDLNDFLRAYSAYDQNLVGNLEMEGGSFQRRGTRGSYTYRLTIPGLERAKNVLRELFGAG